MKMVEDEITKYMYLCTYVQEIIIIFRVLIALILKYNLSSIWMIAMECTCTFKKSKILLLQSWSLGPWWQKIWNHLNKVQIFSYKGHHHYHNSPHHITLVFSHATLTSAQPPPSPLPLWPAFSSPIVNLNTDLNEKSRCQINFW